MEEGESGRVVRAEEVPKESSGRSSTKADEKREQQDTSRKRSRNQLQEDRKDGRSEARNVRPRSIPETWCERPLFQSYDARVIGEAAKVVCAGKVVKR